MNTDVMSNIFTYDFIDPTYIHQKFDERIIETSIERLTLHFSWIRLSKALIWVLNFKEFSAENESVPSYRSVWNVKWTYQLPIE